MRVLARSLLTLFALSSLSLCALAQSSQKTGTALISGRVTIGGKPAPDITVLLAPGEFSPERKALARTVTDVEGNYRLMNVTAGHYIVSPVTPTLTGKSDNMYGMTGRSVIIGEGETIEKIDFALTRGGIITGRVTDADGKPVIEERVQISNTENQNRSRFGFYSNPFMNMTDDRGVYRIYGLPPGRYTVSAGVSPRDGMVRMGMASRGYYQRTYYPNETDIKKATVIEVTEGGEVKDVDIKMGRPSQTFAVSGRVVDADTGQPVPNIQIGYGAYRPEDKSIMAFGYGQARTDARGQFQFEGIIPGRFAAFVWSEAENYSEPVSFEITDTSISGLELKMRRGATITGTVQLEGTSDKRTLARLQQLTIGVNVQSSGIMPPADRQSAIGADGSFRLTGLSPGKATLFIYGFPPPKDIRLARVERDGTPQPQGIEIAPGAEVGNVRVVLEYGSGRLRGQVRVENGTLPEGTRIFILINKQGEEPEAQPVSFAQVDTRGRFLVEGLPAGDYQVSTRLVSLPGAPGKLPTAKQSVSIANGIETETTLVLDMAEKDTGGNKP